MSDRDAPGREVRERLQAATRRAAEEAARAAEPDGAARGGAATTGPSPGDLFVVPATAEHDVEWLLVTLDGEGPGRGLLVPTIAEEGAGPGDLEVPEEEPGGPLQLRCRHRLWVPASMLDPALRTGRLGSRWVASAERLCTGLEGGTVPSTPLQRETAEDPDYRDRDRELAAARDALQRAAAQAPAGGGAPPAPLPAGPGEGSRAPDANAGPSAPRPSNVEPLRRRPGPFSSVPVLRMAAALLLVAVGLSTWWGLGLRTELEELGQPHFGLLSEVIEVRSVRSGDPPPEEVVVGERLPAIPLFWDHASGAYRLELRDEAGRVLVDQTIQVEEGNTYVLTLPRTGVPPGDYTLHVPNPDDPDDPLLDRRVTLTP